MHKSADASNLLQTQLFYMYQPNRYYSSTHLIEVMLIKPNVMQEHSLIQSTVIYAASDFAVIRMI